MQSSKAQIPGHGKSTQYYNVPQQTPAPHLFPRQGNQAWETQDPVPDQNSNF